MQGISFQHPRHVYIGVPLHEQRCQTHDVVLYHLTVFWKCICKKDQFFASVVMHPDYQLYSDFGVGVASWERWGTASVGRAEVEPEVFWL